MAKKKKKTAAERQQSASPRKSSGSESDWDKDEASPVRKKKRTKKVKFFFLFSFPNSSNNSNRFSTQFSRSSSESQSDDEPPQTVAKPTSSQYRPNPPEDDKSDKSELEEGQVATDSDSDSWDSEFNDGYDENLMGDESDRARLEGLSEKERETEIFKRIERRDEMKTRWEIEKKLRHIKRGGKDKVITPKDQKLKDEQRKKKKEKARLEAAAAMTMEKPIIKEVVPSVSKPITTERKNEDAEENWDSEPEYFDPKERSKERKKNVEMNRTDDKRSNAMAMLKAKREGKQKRGKLLWLVLDSTPNLN